MVYIKLSSIKDVEQFFTENYQKYTFDNGIKDTWLINKETRKVDIVIEHKTKTAKYLHLCSIVNS